MSDYKTNGYLVSLLLTAVKDPGNADHSEAEGYLVNFRSFEEKFYNEVHPYIDMGLAISESENNEPGENNIFTVHGCQHIHDLIKSLDKFAEEIDKEESWRISVLEAYILLCAAHVHDTANIISRDDHPKRCKEIISKYKALFSGTPVIQQVYDVASAHGGKHPDYGKDTIRVLDGDNLSRPRLPLLAALLRLADELSENPQRVPSLVAENHSHSNASKLAFAYARCFKRFEFRKASLFLVYNVYPEQYNLNVFFNGEHTNFYDYLEQRIDLIDREARYCSQYARPVFNIAEIRVTIIHYESEPPSQFMPPQEFRLPLYHGYIEPDDPICQRSPELKVKNIEHLRECFIQLPPKSSNPCKVNEII